MLVGLRPCFINRREQYFRMGMLFFYQRPTRPYPTKEYSIEGDHVLWSSTRRKRIAEALSIMCSFLVCCSIAMLRLTSSHITTVDGVVLKICKFL